MKDLRPNHVGLFELGYRYATWAEVEVLADVLEVDPYWLSDRPKPGPAVPIGSGLAKAKEETPLATSAAEQPRSAVSAELAMPAPRVAATTEAATPATASPPPSPSPASSRLPPADVPVRNGSTETIYRAELGQLLAKANQTLLDRSLAPAEWRAWRDYAERVKTTLRTL